MISLTIDLVREFSCLGVQQIDRALAGQGDDLRDGSPSGTDKDLYASQN